MRVLSSHSHLRPTIGEDGDVMSTVWKVLAALALVVPMGAYVVGSLAASATDGPPPRQTIEIRESTPTPTPSSTPTPEPTSTPSPTDDDEVEVITPDYDDFDEDDDHGDDDGDDHSGHGRGGDEREDPHDD